jgi:hypothetical protein
MTEKDCEDIINLIEEAYTVLSDPHKRRLYNKARGLSSPPEDQESNSNNFQTNNNNALQQLVGSNSINNPDSYSKNGSTRPLEKKDITKIVASKRFALDFTISPEFEQEIEQTTIFTGEILKNIREYKKVDIPRMADMTKVSKTYIKNIEEESFDKLPAFVYVRGFVYQYAKCLKLNPDLVATSYINHMKQLKGD